MAYNDKTVLDRLCVQHLLRVVPQQTSLYLPRGEVGTCLVLQYSSSSCVVSQVSQSFAKFRKVSQSFVRLCVPIPRIEKEKRHSPAEVSLDYDNRDTFEVPYLECRRQENNPDANLRHTQCTHKQPRRSAYTFGRNSADCVVVCETATANLNVGGFAKVSQTFANFRKVSQSFANFRRKFGKFSQSDRIPFVPKVFTDAISWKKFF